MTLVPNDIWSEKAYRLLLISKRRFLVYMVPKAADTKDAELLLNDEIAGEKITKFSQALSNAQIWR